MTGASSKEATRELLLTKIVRCNIKGSEGQMHGARQAGVQAQPRRMCVYGIRGC